MNDFIDTAKKIFAGTKYDASENGIKILANNMVTLEKRGLGKLNQRLIDVRKHDKIFETIAEHNFAMLLVSNHCSAIPIKYEDPQIDFKVEIGDITYWIQMKALSKLERENRQKNIIQQIKKETEKIKIGKYFSCSLSDDFKEDCLQDLIEFIKDKAESASEGKKVFFTGKRNQTAEVTFRLAKNIALSELTLGDWSDLEKDIDICDALFGTEYYVGQEGGSLSWNRKNDGLFVNDDFSKKVAGVIAVKRKCERNEEIALLPQEYATSRLSQEEAEYAKNWDLTPKDIKEAIEWSAPGPIADYSANFYINDYYKQLLKDVEKLIGLDKVIYYNIRPVDKGNFERDQ